MNESRTLYTGQTLLSRNSLKTEEEFNLKLKFLTEEIVNGELHRWVTTRFGNTIRVRSDLPTTSKLFIQEYKSAWNEESYGANVITESLDSALKQCVRQARTRAKLRQREFGLTIAFARSLFFKQQGLCSISKIQFQPFNQSAKSNPFRPSIDRIDTNGGYSKDNVRLVCWGVNAGLNEFDFADYLKICRSVSEQNKS